MARLLRLTFSIVAAAAVGIASTACSGRTGAQGGASGMLTSSLPRHGGGEVDLVSLRGKVVVLDVLASWAEGSPLATKALGEIARELGGRGVEFFGLAIDADYRFVERYALEHSPPYPLLKDAGAELAERELGVRRVPAVLVVDRTGRVRFRHEGFTRDLAREVTAEIERLLAEEPGAVH